MRSLPTLAPSLQSNCSNRMTRSFPLYSETSHSLVLRGLDSPQNTVFLQSLNYTLNATLLNQQFLRQSKPFEPCHSIQYAMPQVVTSGTVFSPLKCCPNYQRKRSLPASSDIWLACRLRLLEQMSRAKVQLPQVVYQKALTLRMQWPEWRQNELQTDLQSQAVISCHCPSCARRSTVTGQQSYCPFTKALFCWVTRRKTELSSCTCRLKQEQCPAIWCRLWKGVGFVLHKLICQNSWRTSSAVRQHPQPRLSLTGAQTRYGPEPDPVSSTGCWGLRPDDQA